MSRDGSLKYPIDRLTECYYYAVPDSEEKTREVMYNYIQRHQKRLNKRFIIFRNYSDQWIIACCSKGDRKRDVEHYFMKLMRPDQLRYLVNPEALVSSVPAHTPEARITGSTKADRNSMSRPPPGARPNAKAQRVAAALAEVERIERRTAMAADVGTSLDLFGQPLELKDES